MEIYTGDCMQIMKDLIKDKSVNCVITSPPYNIKKSYKLYKDNLPHEQYLDWMEHLAKELKRVLAPNGHIFLNIGYTNLQPWIATDVVLRFRNHFVLQNHIIWVKHIKLGLDTFGIYKPINSDRFSSPVWESIFHLTHTGKEIVNCSAVSGEYGPKQGKYEESYTEDACLIRHENTLRRRACKMLFKHKKWKEVIMDPRFISKFNELKEANPFEYNKPKDEGNVWYIPYEPISKLAKQLNENSLGTNDTGKAGHPAVFPLNLVKRCLLFAGYQKDWVIFDPFLGTGTTLLACQKLDLQGAIGVELDPSYVQFTKRRLNVSSSLTKFMECGP